MKKRSLIALTATFLLTACTPPPALDRWPEAKLTGNNLEDVEYALYLSPQVVGSTPVDRSYLALIKADGSYETIRVDGLDNGGVFWTEEGIHFADKSADYLLTDEKLEKWSLEKSDLMYGYNLHPDGSTVGLYSFGSQENQGYTTQVIQRNGDDVISFPTEGSYYDSGICPDGTIVGISPTTGHYKNDGVEEKILVTIDEKEEKEKLVLNFPNYHTPANDLHCRDGKVFALGTLPEENEYGSYQYGDVLTFDLETREFLAVPVTDKEGAPLPLTHEDGTGVAHAQAIDNEAIKDGKLSWYLGNTIYETDVATGVTNELFDISATKQGLSNSQVVFREVDIVVFSYNQDEEIQMVRYDRSTGHELDRVQVDGLTEKTSIKMIPRGFAAKPLT